MPRCEDFPCCGHESGDCPTIDSKGRAHWSCTECGGRLGVRATSSICPRCQRKMARMGDYYEFYRSDR